MDNKLPTNERKGNIMDFKTEVPIYKQIVDICFAKIRTGEWTCKVQSVRELALELTVNPRTVLRAYDYLQNENIIAPKRGMGMFLTDGAYTKVIHILKQEFLHDNLEEMFYKMDLLDIDIEEVVEIYKKRKEK